MTDRGVGRLRRVLILVALLAGLSGTFQELRHPLRREELLPAVALVCAVVAAVRMLTDPRK